MRRLVWALAMCAVASGASAAPVQWGGNGHWYEYVAGAFTWDDARVAAAARTHLGLQGYLATTTSAGEETFIETSVTQNTAWLGGSDEWDPLSENDQQIWKWMTGPEAGQTFWDRGVTLIYARWNGGEPNNCCGGEDYLQDNFGGLGWNDHGGPGNAGQRNGYIVEYSERIVVPEPASLALFGLVAAAGLLRRRGH